RHDPVPDRRAAAGAARQEDREGEARGAPEDALVALHRRPQLVIVRVIDTPEATHIHYRVRR
ncbi:MAG TPA: hypothetical protein VNP90_08310, partial [Actinomycetota bacterium]|nr:hypothetical protein [Actinomycetota bacterium]